jgi:hypothetical protein
MSAEQDLINRLMISKKIMEKHDTIGRGGVQGITPSQINNYSTEVEEFPEIKGNYNLPEEFLTEAPIKQYNTEIPSQERIANSKLPEEIKRLMLEHPIHQPNNPMSGPGLSNDLVEKASRLMNSKANGELINENTKVKRQTTQSNISLSANDIKNIVRETVEDVLKENGLLVESTKNSNEIFKFRVGQHIFEGKLTKIKKVSE